MLVMALDLGTSGARALCFDARGRALPGAEARVGYQAQVTPDGGVELDPAALCEAAAAAVDGCLAAAGPGAAADIRAVGASVFWHSLLALDAGGTPLTPVLTWADTRSAGTAARLRRELDERQVHARTGAYLHAAFFPARLAWLRATRPAVFERAAAWGGFAEYLFGRLTGERRASLSMASGTGLLDQRTACWDAALLAACGVGPGQLPPVEDRPAAGLVPAFAARWPALARARWFPAWGDGACSNVGSDAAGPARLALNVGTSAALRVVLPAEPDPGPAPWGLWRYRVDAGRALVGGATSEGGNVIAWCRRVLALPPDREALERALAALPADGHGLTVLPFLAGERSPGWRPEARGTVAGLGLDTGPLSLLRACLEGVAHRLALVYERLAPLAARDHQVIASGGAIEALPPWAQILADALGIPLTLAGEREASARGAALLALRALGAPAPDPLPPGPTLVPDPGRHEIYRRARERQRRLYETVVGPTLS